MTMKSNKFNQMLTFASKNIFCMQAHVTSSALPFKLAFRFSIFSEILHDKKLLNFHFLFIGYGSNPFDCPRKCETESCSCIQLGMACTKA